MDTKIELKKNPLSEIFSYFSRLGFLGFGGPFALIAICQKDLVEKKRWISPERFSQALALIKALPGPTATQVVIYLGLVRGGRIGGLLAGACLIFPAFLMMVGLGYFYSSIEQLSWGQALLFGMQAAAIGVIAESIWKLTKPYKNQITFWCVGLIAAVIVGLRPGLEPLVIIGSGILGVFIPYIFKQMRKTAFVVEPVSLALLVTLGWVCVKAGAFVFGTGLAVVPMLSHDVVDKMAWLNHRQFMDALAFGQVTPGPVVITATFIGFRVAGILGALVATTAVFSPGFFNLLTWFPWFESRFSKHPWAAKFVSCAIAAVVGSIVITLGSLIMAPEFSGSYIAFGLISVFALGLSLWGKIPTWLIIPVCGVIAGIVHQVF